jgi:hypothetical protein
MRKIVKSPAYARTEDGQFYHMIHEDDRVPIGGELIFFRMPYLHKVTGYVEDVTGVKTNVMAREKQEDGQWLYIGHPEDIGVVTEDLGTEYLEELHQTPMVLDQYEYNPSRWEVFGAQVKKCREVTERLKEAGGEPPFALHGCFRLVKQWAVSGADYGSDYMNEWEWQGKPMWNQGWFPNSMNPEIEDWQLYINNEMPKDELRIGNDKCLAIIEIKGMDKFPPGAEGYSPIRE